MDNIKLDCLFSWGQEVSMPILVFLEEQAATKAGLVGTRAINLRCSIDISISWCLHDISCMVQKQGRLPKMEICSFKIYQVPTSAVDEVHRRGEERYF